MGEAARAWVVVGLAFGDEGKGSLVDALARQHGASLVVRFNGGCQAAHHVVAPDGRTHCFAQLGAGTLIPGVRTHLARALAIDPLALFREADALAAIGVPDALARLSLDPKALVVTPFHASLNRIRELCRGAERHGSVGVGVGEALLDAEGDSVPVIWIGDAKDPERLARTLRLLWRMKIDVAEQLIEGAEGPGLDREALDRELERLTSPEPGERLLTAMVQLVRASPARLIDDQALTFPTATILEGAQGVLLDRDHGFFPHVTPSRTTFTAAEALLTEAGFTGPITRVGVLRAYATRHGRGPLVTEDRALAATIPDRHNLAHPFQEAFRIGWFDAVAARYALQVTGGVRALALTNLDRLASFATVRVCVGYQLPDHAELVRDLPSLPAEDFGARAAFTARLAHAEPVYVELPGWRDATDPNAEGFLRFLESREVLGRPIDRVSWGPRALDQVERQALSSER